MSVLSRLCDLFRTPNNSGRREERASSIMNAPTPQNKVELKSFLELMTYNSRFLPSLAHVLHPLHNLVHKDARWGWSHAHVKAFKEAKKLVSVAPVLLQYDITKQLKVYCDASPCGVGACLIQVMNGHGRPVAYASRTLTSAATNYAQIERETLVIMFSVKKFHQYLYGRYFVLVTDHRPLCKILGHNQGVPSLAPARMQMWALILSAYQYTLQHIPGSQNQCADCMSRLPTPCHARDSAEYNYVECFSYGYIIITRDCRGYCKGHLLGMRLGCSVAECMQ